MTEKLKKVIKRELEKLPRETQEAINIVDWVNIAEQIGERHLLDQSEINDLQVQTLLVLVGLRDADLFQANIENEVGTSKNEAEKISAEVFEKIFEPIVEKLEENIRKNMKDKNASWEQNTNFILSGGDYSVFIDNTEKTPARNAGGLADAGRDKLLGGSNILATKRKFDL